MEMFNNAVDHSAGVTVRFLMRYEAGIISLSIQDDGIGIFEKIKSHFGLEDYRQAMLELSKGKLTTDTTQHSGQGIFFTSRMFDRFVISIERPWILLRCRRGRLAHRERGAP